jgi:nitrogen fixation protein NifU and related proteins
MYSQKVIELINSPVNLEKMRDPDGEGTIEDTQNGEFFSFYIKVEFGTIKKVSFWTNGDNETMAYCSIITVIAQGKHLSEALKMTKQDIIDALDWSDEVNQYRLQMIISALRKSIHNYLLRRGIYYAQFDKNDI